jgi:hypothetical protein
VNRSTLRIAIIILTLITAVVHLALAIMDIAGGHASGLSYAFIANGIGYIALLAALFMDVPYFRDHRDVAHWLMIAFAGVTLVGYFVMNGFQFGTAAIIAKAAEILLIIATFLHMRAS